MSACGAAVRDPVRVKHAAEEAWALLRRLESGTALSSARQLPAAFKNLDLCLTQALYLEAIKEYLDKGGKSRGSYLVLDRNGVKPCPELGDQWRFSLNPRRALVDRKILEIFLDDSGEVVKKWVNIRPIPNVEGWFESVWRDFREDRIVREEE